LRKSTPVNWDVPVAVAIGASVGWKSGN